MRVLDFSDGFVSSTAPALGSIPASSVSVNPVGNVTSTDMQSAITEVQTHVDAINAEKAAINGLASLDSAGHIPLAQLPSAALGALRYQGVLDASMGTYPVSPVKGDFYVISVSGTIAAKAYIMGDWAAFDGTGWDKIDNSQTVASVAGRIGAVVLTNSDVGLSNVDNTSDASKNSAAVTLSNKTLASPVIDILQTTDQGSIPATPTSGHKLYSKGAGMFILDSTGTEKPVGSGGGGGVKNYLSAYNGNTGNGDFELGNTNGWSKFNTTLTGVNPTGSISAGASSFTIFGIASGTSLSGSKSLAAGGASGLTAGEGFISDTFNIDVSDMGRVQTISASYQFVNGTIDYSGTPTSTFALWMYDVTNSVWIQPDNCYGITQSAGCARFSSTFQTSGTGTQYRLAVICVNGAAGLTNMLWDDFSVGPKLVLNGTLRTVGALLATGSVTPPQGYLYADGSAISRIHYGALFSIIGTQYGIGDGATTFNLPDTRGLFLRGAGTNGTMVDANGNPYTASLGATQTDQMQGHYHAFSNNVSIQTGGLNDSTTCVRAADRFGAISGVTAVTPISDGTNGTPRTGVETHGANVAVAFHICFDEGSIQVTTGKETGVISFSGSGGSGQGLSASVTDIAFTTVSDRTNCWNGSQFIVKVSGDYFVSGNNSTTVSQTPSVYLNGIQYSGNYFSTALGGSQASGSVLLADCKVGDAISLRSNTNGTTYNSTLSIFRLSASSVITDLVAPAGPGGINRNVTSISSSTTALATVSTDFVYLVSGTTTLTLPTAVANLNKYTVKNTGSQTVTIATTSSQTIDVSPAIDLPTGESSVDIVSDGANWNLI